MLYITTRNKNDAHTAFHALGKDRGPDGGLYVPFQMPVLSQESLAELKDKTFGQCVAEILNLFFSARLDGWDVDFCVGRYPAKLVRMGNRMVVAETWNNPDWDFARMVRNLSSRILGSDDTKGVPGDWAWIAVRIAVLFALYGELSRQGLVEADKKFDVAVTAGDFSAPMAVWYAKKMGLPVGTIICGCNDNSAPWDLLHRGELRMDGLAVRTSTPSCDLAVPKDLERLISGVLGIKEAMRFSQCAEQGKDYIPSEEDLAKLRSGMFAAVVSQKRMDSVIRNVYRTSTYLLDPYGALAYGGLQDYRFSTGEGRTALLLTEQGPVRSASVVASAMGLSEQELLDRIGKS